MSAKVDIANISADQGRSVFANTGCRSSGAVVQGDGRSSASSFNETRTVLQSDQVQWDKSPFAPETQKQAAACSKRHYSFSVVERNVTGKQRRNSDKFAAGAVTFSGRRRGGRMGRYHATDRLRERIVLPTRFLLGGNITDPLNLNSLCDDEVNKSMNETTPISSPVPIPTHRMEVRVLVPVNSADPLNLNAEDNDSSAEITEPSLPRSVFRKRRKRNRRRRRKRNSVLDEQHQSAEQVDLEKSLEIEVGSKEEMQLDKPADDTGVDSSTRYKRVIDHIVSPVIPQKTSKWKRRRTASESRAETATEALKETQDGIKVEKTLTRHKRRHLSVHMGGPHVPLHFRANDKKFSHGNYSGNMTLLGKYVDPRLAYFSKEMFSGKDVLDVGCGVGHMSLSIARDFGARRVVGLDVDQKVVETALKNKQHFASAMLSDVERFPVAIRRRLGPLVAPQLLPSSDTFHHVTFLMGDYVPRSEGELEQQREEYDVILGLRITKWIHLNYGDVGLQWTFRRMYKQLRPGGLLVLEMQPWKSYRKKKKLTEHIFQTYRSIQFRPDMFVDFLMSQEVGFGSIERLRPQSRQCIGLKQPLYVFKKLLREAVLPMSTSQSLVSVRSGGVALQRELVACSTYGTPECTSSCFWLTPKFEVGSTSCSTTPCSTRCRNTPNGADDVTNAASPCSSSSSSSSSSSAASSCDPMQTSLTEVGAGCSESLAGASAHTQSCSVSDEPLTSANAATDTARHSDEPQSMHCTARCSCPRVVSDTELLHRQSPS